MSASTAELQVPVDEILALLGVKISAGQLVVHLNDQGCVQKVEVNSVHRPKRMKDEE